MNTLEQLKTWKIGQKKYDKFVNNFFGKKFKIMTPKNMTLEDLAKYRYGSKDFLRVAIIEYAENLY